MEHSFTKGYRALEPVGSERGRCNERQQFWKSFAKNSRNKNGFYASLQIPMSPPVD